MSSPLLDAALIVKNEAPNIVDCVTRIRAALGSVLADVCVYDTGSTDDTVALARGVGARVTRGEWADSFAEAKNHALAMTTARWAIVVDADERLRGDPARLRRALEGDADAPTFEVQAVIDSPNGVASRTAAMRVLDPRRVRFVNRVHERPVLISGGPPPAGEIPEAALILTHHGYTAEARGPKAARNLRLARLQVDERRAAGAPNLPEALFELGRAYSAADDPEAALPYWTEAWHLGGASPWAADSARRLCETHLAAGRLTECLDVLERSRTLHDEHTVRWILGRVALAADDPAAAYEQLRRVDHVTDAFHTRHSMTPVTAALATAAWQAGHTDEALALMIRLTAAEEDVEGLWPSLLAAWGDRPIPALADLIRRQRGAAR